MDDLPKEAASGTEVAESSHVDQERDLRQDAGVSQDTSELFSPSASGEIDERKPLLKPASSSTSQASTSAARLVESSHFHSLSVHVQTPGVKKPCPGALSIVERDTGAPDDLFSIEVNLFWKSHERADTPSESATLPISVSVDDLLAMRIHLNASPHPRVVLHAQGGGLVGCFLFLNGRDAAMQFVSVLRKHVDTSLVPDRKTPGELHLLESRPRMRRVAPPLEDVEDLTDGVSGMAVDGGGNVDPSGGPVRENDQSFVSSGSGHARRRRSRANVRDPDSGVLRPSPGMMVLEGFARVTQFARDVGDDFQWAFSEERRKQDAVRRERVRLARERALNIYADLAWPEAEPGTENRPRPPLLVLDTKRGVPLSEEGWLGNFGEDGVLSDPGVMRLAVFAGGVTPELRPRVWPFLLGLFPWDSSEASRNKIVQKNIDSYAELKSRWLNLKSEATTADSVTKAEALEKAAAAAAAAIEAEENTMKKEAMLQSGEIRVPDRDSRVSKAHATYLATDEQIAKDIVRTDRKVDSYKQDNSRLLNMMGDILNVYAVHNRSIGYCQGMSDFLSPLLYVFGEHEEAMTFWCFEALMRRYQGNFMVDQSGMNATLGVAKGLLQASDKELFEYFSETDPDFYCIFRWMLVCFKREMPFDSTSRLWEILWTRHVGGDRFHIYVAVALLRAHRRNILKLAKGEFDMLLRYVNDMSMRIDVNFAVKQAELLHREYN